MNGGAQSTTPRAPDARLADAPGALVPLVRVVPGHLPGCTGPGVLLRLAPLQMTEATAREAALDRLMAALEAHDVAGPVPRLPAPDGLPAALVVCWRSLQWLGAWQVGLGVPLVGSPRLVAGGQTGAAAVWLETPAAPLYGALLRWWFSMCERLAAQPVRKALTPAERVEWERWAVRAVEQVPSGTNNAQMLRAAHLRGVPMRRLTRDRFQFGWGRRGRWLMSTLTDATPSMGVQVARDKALTHQLLAWAGLPVPQQAEVGSEQAAQAAAQRMGFPVVVKPADRDGGVGARAGLTTPDAVAQAYAQARQFSRRVLVEQHVAGHEYRLTVVHGQLFWAHQRVPAQVVGDGVLSLQALVNRENQRRRLAASDSPGLRPIHVDEGVLAYLAERALTMQSVPPAGEPVRLQRVPAAFTGGDGQAYTQTLHPDNAWLAERAARLLRMDVAGVDLIMPDVTRSWREVGGAITEVNAIPQVSNLTQADLHERLLQHLVPGDGRIPVLVVLVPAQGAADVVEAAPWLHAVCDGLAEAGLVVGLSTAEALTLGGRWVRGPRTSAFEDVQLLQLEPSTGVLVVVTDGEEWAAGTGVPFDRLDGVVKTAALDPASAGARLLEQMPTGLVWTAPAEADAGAEAAWVTAVVAALVAADAVHAAGAATDGMFKNRSEP